MATHFTFRNMEATEGLKEHTNGKLKKLTNFLIKPEDIHVICSLDHIDQCAEITVVDNGQHFVCLEKSSDMYASIDRAVEKLVRQLKKNKEKLKNKKHVTPLRNLSI